MNFKHKPFGELISIDELFEIIDERTPKIEKMFNNAKKVKVLKGINKIGMIVYEEKY